MKSIKQIGITLAVLLLAGWAHAQQDAMYTHYMFNTLAVNPGYAGSRDALTITGLHRTQWAGFEGAPNTQTLTLHTPVLRDEFGVGFSLVNDNIGPSNVLSFYLDLAYHLKINDKGHQLAFGLKGGGNLVQTDFTDFQLDQIDDPSFTGGSQSEFLPNAGFGLYYYTDRWYAGLSTPKMLENSFQYSEVGGSVNDPGEEQRHYFLIGGAVFDLTDKIKLKPTTFLKMTQAAPVELDLTGTLLFDDKFSFGLMGRTGDAFGALIGYQFSPQLSAGYSFDFSVVNTTARYNGGSHEIMLRYDFIYKEKGKIRSPRYF